MNLRSFYLPLALSAWMGVFCCEVAQADTFFLASGGKIEGRLANPTESPRTSYVVHIDAGGEITLPAAAVKRLEQKSAERIQYEKMRPAMSDTLEDHWKMAEWCRENGLKEERTDHLESVLRHDSDFEKARHGLGYSRVNGRWVIMEEYNIAQGLVRHRGGWWMPQDVAIAQNAQNFKERTGEWRKKLKVWRGWFGGKRSAEAVQHFRDLRDPLAAGPLGELLEKETSREVKTMFMEILSRLGGHAASTALVKQAIEDNDDIVRDRALDQLSAKEWPGVRGVLRRALEHEDPIRINRAAIALGRLKDTDAIPQLIDALTSTKKVVIKKGGGGGLGQIGAGFGNGGSGGISAGSKPVVLQGEVPNESVLNALRHLTRADFGYSRERWNDWYTQVSTPKNVDLRRRD